MVKAVVCGAAGGIGQPLSLLLKLSPYVTELALYDVVNAPGVAVDISHISTTGAVTGYLPQDDGLSKALKGADIVLIPAGVPRKPGMTRDDLFKINAGIVQSLAEGIAKNCPNAFVLIISNPVNSTVPVAVETLKKHNAFNPHRVFGITNLDAVRARTFAAEKIGADPQKIFIPIVGGHSGDTIVPLISLANTSIKFGDAERDAFVHRVQYGGDEVVQAKEGKGSSTLAMAYAGFNCAEAVMRAMTGETGIIQSTFIYLDNIEGGPEIKKLTGTDYFASPVELGQDGVVRIINYIKDANDYEKHLLQVAIPGLKNNIAKGIDFVTGTNKL